MKTFLPVLLLSCLVSCSQTPSKYAFEGPAATRPAVKTAPAAAPAPIQAAVVVVETNAPATRLAVSKTNAAATAITPAGKAAGPTPGVVTNGIAQAAPTAAAKPAESDGSDEPAESADTEDVIPAGTINFPATDLNQVLQIYSELVNRTVLRPANLPAPAITLKTQTPLTKKEAIQAFDAVLAMNGITMINVGDKFVKAVPVGQANQEGAAFSRTDGTKLPEVGPYVTHVVQLKYLKTSEVLPALQPFAKIPNSILPVESSQILVLRDYTENVKRMLEMIAKIDISVPSEFVSEVIPIKYAKAEEIASALNSLTTGGGGGSTVGRTGGTGGSTATRMGATGFTRPGASGYQGGAQPGSVGLPGASGVGGATGSGSSFTDRMSQVARKAASSTGDLQIIGPNKIIADERSNSLLIFAGRQDMEMIKTVVAKLDVVLAQVIIETAILNVNLGDKWNFGLSGSQKPKQFTPNVAGGGGNNNGQPFFDFVNGLAGGGTNAASTLFPGNFASALPSGFTYWAKLGQTYDLALQAAASDSRVSVVQRPQILTSHATPGSIFIGKTVPYVTSTYYGGGYGGGPSSSYQQLQVGIGLTVTPYINPDGLVVMQIDETIDELAGTTPITGVGDVPNTSSRKLSGEVAVRDGDTVMLGGFIRNDRTASTAGIPILKDIPLLGALFSSKSDSKTREELVVLMRPTVLRTPEIAAAETTRIKKEQMPGILGAEADERALQRKAVKREQAEERKRSYNEEAPVTPEERELYGLPPATTP